MQEVPSRSDALQRKVAYGIIAAVILVILVILVVSFFHRTPLNLSVFELRDGISSYFEKNGESIDYVAETIGDFDGVYCYSFYIDKTLFRIPLCDRSNALQIKAIHMASKTSSDQEADRLCCILYAINTSLCGSDFKEETDLAVAQARRGDHAYYTLNNSSIFVSVDPSHEDAQYLTVRYYGR